MSVYPKVDLLRFMRNIDDRLFVVIYDDCNITYIY